MKFYQDHSNLGLELASKVQVRILFQENVFIQESREFLNCPYYNYNSKSGINLK